MSRVACFDNLEPWLKPNPGPGVLFICLRRLCLLFGPQGSRRFALLMTKSSAANTIIGPNDEACVVQ